MAKYERDTDPYGYMAWTIGSDEGDFWCFDFVVSEDGKMVKLHAVINSETGSFIQDAEEPVEVPIYRACEEAKRLEDAALDWCGENGVSIDLEPDSVSGDQTTHDFSDAVRLEARKLLAHRCTVDFESFQTPQGHWYVYARSRDGMSVDLAGPAETRGEAITDAYLVVKSALDFALDKEMLERFHIDIAGFEYIFDQSLPGEVMSTD